MNAPAPNPISPTDPTPRPPRRRSGVVVPHRATPLQRVAGWIIYLAIQTLVRTTRFRIIDSEGCPYVLADKQHIFAIWHNRLVYSLPVHHRFVRRRNRTRRLAAMVSASRDGGFLTSVLELFQTEPVRGSSSRRGSQALRELVTWAGQGRDLAITPDGPRGPRYVVQEGIIALAQLTGLPIIPIGTRVRWKLHVPSWDRFQIPLPFARCDVIAGPTIVVPRDATPAQRENLRQQLEAALRRNSGD